MICKEKINLSTLEEAIEALCTLRQMRLYIKDKMHGESVSPSHELMNKFQITSYPEVWKALERYEKG